MTIAKYKNRIKGLKTQVSREKTQKVDRIQPYKLYDIPYKEEIQAIGDDYAPNLVFIYYMDALNDDGIDSPGVDINEYEIYEDFTLMEQLQELIIAFLGRHTYSELLTGCLYGQNGIIRFIARPWKGLINTLKRDGLSLPHRSLLHNDRSLYTDERIMLFYSNYIALGLRMKVEVIKEVGQRPVIEILSAPTVPSWVFLQSKVGSYYDFSTKLFIQILESQLSVLPTSNLDTALRLYDRLLRLYDFKLSCFQLGGKEIIYRTLFRESLRALLFYGFSSKPIAQLNTLVSYLENEGYMDETLDLKSFRFRVENLKIIPDIQKEFLKMIRALELPGGNAYFRAELSDFYAEAYTLLVDLLSEYEPGSISRIDSSLRTKLSLMKEPITDFAAFLKTLAQDAAERGKKIIIEPYQMYWDGLRNPNHRKEGFIEYLPSKDPRYGHNERILTIDGSSPNSLAQFDSDFPLLLGGFLVDGQTIIIREEGMASDEMICAFNLPCGILGPNQVIPSVISRKNCYAPSSISSSAISAEHRAMLEEVLREFMKVPYAFSIWDVGITEWREAYDEQLSLGF